MAAVEAQNTLQNLKTCWMAGELTGRGMKEHRTSNQDVVVKIEKADTAEIYMSFNLAVIYLRSNTKELSTRLRLDGDS